MQKRQRWFARPLAGGEMVIDTPGRVVQVHRYDPALDELAVYRPLTPLPAGPPLLTHGQAQAYQVRPPGSWWG